MHITVVVSATLSTVAYDSTRNLLQLEFRSRAVYLRGAQIVLRSKTPELVKQEFWGLLSTRDEIDFAAQYPACLCPCQRFTSGIRIFVRREERKS